MLCRENDILRREGVLRIIQQVIERQQEYGKILLFMLGVITLRADFLGCGLVDKRGENKGLSRIAFIFFLNVLQWKIYV